MGFMGKKINKWTFTQISNEVLDDTEEFANVYDKMIFIALSRFAKKSTGLAFPSIRRLATVCKCSKNTVRSSLRRLESKGMIVITQRISDDGQTSNLYRIIKYRVDGDSIHEGGGSPSEGEGDNDTEGGSSTTEPELYKDDDNKVNNIYSPEYLEFWDAYPHKVGKKKCYALWKKRIKHLSPNSLIHSSKNYAKYCNIEKVEKRYIKHPSTFLSNNLDFEDFIEPFEGGTSPLTKQSKEKEQFAKVVERNRWIDSGGDPDEFCYKPTT